MVHGKGKVGFPAPKIQYCNLPVLRELGQDILNKLQETVDLAEFIILCLYNFPFIGLHAQVHQKPHFFPWVKDIILFSIM